MDGYATHIEPLVKAALATPGNILELGCGDYSTPILAAIAHSRGDILVVCASDPAWADRYQNVADVILIVDWNTWKVPDGDWGLVFLDNEEHAPQRILRLQQLKSHCRTIVMHDASQARECSGFDICTSGFAHADMYEKHVPWTLTLTC